MKYSTFSLGKLVKIKYGKNQKHVVSDEGKIPIYGTGGIMGYATEFLYDKPSVLIGRKGTIGKVKYADHPFWTVDTLFYTEVNEEIVLPKFLFYLMSQLDLNVYNEGTTIPSLRTETLNRLEFSIPPLSIQRKIVSILSALDDKIETNNAICRNLEELLLAVYRNVKYVNECVVKELHDLAEFSKNKKQISELNCQSYFSTENMLPGKAGAVAAESLPTMPKATACNPGDILVSNIRPYFKKIVYCSTNCGCSSDVLCFHPKEDIYSTWLFCSLYEDDFFDYVAAGSKGTKMPRGDKAYIMRYGIAVPTREKLEEFKATGDLVLSQINCLRSENERLNKLREVILPKLMNGKLDIENIKA